MLEYDLDKVYDIPMKDVFVDEDFNCRGAVNPMDVIDLSRDIKDQGLHTPVFIQPWTKKPGKTFRLVAGYRRFKALQILQDDEEYKTKFKEKVGTVRAMVKPNLDDLDARVLNLSENIQRVNLNMKQEAHAIEPLKRAGWTEQDVARKLAQSRGWVQVRFMLLELPDDVQNEAAAGFLNQAQVRECYKLRENPDAMIDYVKKVKDKRILGKQREPKPEASIVKNEKKIRNESEIFQVQDLIRETFGNNMTTVALGWAAGVVSDWEIHNYLWETAAKSGKFYIMPEGLTRTMSKPAKEAENSDEMEAATS